MNRPSGSPERQDLANTDPNIACRDTGGIGCLNQSNGREAHHLPQGLPLPAQVGPRPYCRWRQSSCRLVLHRFPYGIHARSCSTCSLIACAVARSALAPGSLRTARGELEKNSRPRSPCGDIGALHKFQRWNSDRTKRRSAAFPKSFRCAAEPRQPPADAIDPKQRCEAVVPKRGARIKGRSSAPMSHRF